MGNITAQMVKALREQTGAGMMDCKVALSENDGDATSAIDWLRSKGLSKAAKKSGRVAAEGLVGAATGVNCGVLVEVNAETDFVARNGQFQDLVRRIASIALEVGGDLIAISSSPFPGSSNNVADHIVEQVSTIGENINFRRSTRLSINNGVVSSYIHNATAEGLGRIGVLVALESDVESEKLASVARQLAMHIAATNPLAVSVDELDPNVVARERSILAEQARDSGKPEAIIDKMVEGRIRKYYEEVVLTSQTFVVDGERTVEQVIADLAVEIGASVKIAGFERMALGDGIEREQTDFAAEVAAAANS